MRRLRLVRAPVVTGVVLAVTATTSIAQFYVPGMLEAWQRTPQGLHGQVWRTFTALLVQDGGVVGTLSNLAFLLILGVLAEQVVRRWQWLICYLGAGLVGELAGYAWQPDGAGNSVAVCGLAGALVVALWTQHPFAPRPTPLLVAWWCGLLLASQWLWPGVVLLVAASVLTPRMPTRGLLVGRAAAVVAAVVAVALVAAENVHGAALAAGIVLAALVVRAARPVQATVGRRTRRIGSGRSSSSSRNLKNSLSASWRVHTVLVFAPAPPSACGVSR